MTQPTEPQTQPATAPENLLLALLIKLLAPTFLGVAMGDIALAQAAAAQTIEDFQARSRADLIAIGQIIAFGLAALGSLSLSMEDDVSVSMVLRLRGNANACNRSAEQNRRTLDRSQSHAEASAPLEAAPSPDPQLSELQLPDPQLPTSRLPEPELPEPPATEPFLTEAAEQLLAAESAARLQDHLARRTEETPDKAARAADLLKQAFDLRARIPSLPKAGRKAVIDRITKLTNTARLLTGARA